MMQLQLPATHGNARSSPVSVSIRWPIVNKGSEEISLPPTLIINDEDSEHHCYRRQLAQDGRHSCEAGSKNLSLRRTTRREKDDVSWLSLANFCAAADVREGDAAVTTWTTHEAA